MFSARKGLRRALLSTVGVERRNENEGKNAENREKKAKFFFLISKSSDEFLCRCLARPAERSTHTAHDEINNILKQDSEADACPHTTSKVHVITAGQHKTNTKNITGEKKVQVCSDAARYVAATRTTRPIKYGGEGG